VEEAAAAGITDMVFITGRNKRAIEDHFDKAYELETELALRNKTALLEMVQSAAPPGVNCIYIRQTEALGLGHAVLCAAPVIGDEPFAVLLADDLIDAEVPCLKQMAATYGFHRGSVLGVEEVPRRDTDKYGIVEVDTPRTPVSRIRSIVEKPAPAVAPSTLAVVGRYVLTAGIFDQLRQVGRGAGGEIQLTDGIARLLGIEAVYAHRFVGKRYDCGSKLGYLQATVEFALTHPGLSRSFRSYLLRLTKDMADDEATTRPAPTRPARKRKSAARKRRKS
jgi:UTP--glucose-1-phosphate uridylyltransferase